jgi:release factor glutamine methyltransferase
MLADISEKALKVAKENIALNRVTNAVNVSICDALQPCPSVFGSFDLIVCNPPYIPTSEIPTLDIEVQNEPHLALDGGEDGLDLYRAICVNFRPAVREGGALMFEVGLSQHEDVRDIMLAAGFEDITIFKDLTGIERVVCGVVPYSIEPMEEELQELEMVAESASVEGENEEICPKNGTEENRTNVAEPVQM